MAFDYNTKLAAVIKALKDYNTTTSTPDLSSGLTSRIDDANILGFDPMLETPRADRMPAIYVMIDRKDEDYSALGSTGPSGSMKKAKVDFNIIGIVGKNGGWEGQSTTLADVYDLAENIEGVFQKEFKLSNTAMWCNPVQTDFGAAVKLGEGFAKVVVIKLRAEYLFR